MCFFCDVRSRDMMITKHSTPTQKYNSSNPDPQLSGVAKELAAWIGIFVLVCVVSELVVQCSPHFGTACIAGTILSVVLAARRRGQLEILHVKILLVLAISAATFFRKALEIDRYEHVMFVLLLLNVIVLIAPLCFNEKWILVAQVLLLSLFTPKDPFSETSRSYWQLYVGVLLAFYLQSEVAAQHRVGLLLTLLPMMIPILTNRSEHILTYRCVGMLIFLMSPLLWSPTLQPTPSPFKFSSGNTSWNALSDLAANFEKSRPFKICALLVNICLAILCARDRITA